MAVQYVDTLRNTRLDAVDTAIGASGLLKIYDATGGVPPDPDTAISGQTLLASCAFAATASGAASGGVLTAAAIGDDTSADAAGTPAFARGTTSGGATVFQIDCGVGSGSINFDANISAGATVSIANFLTITDGSA